MGDSGRIAQDDWVTVGEYTDASSAAIVSRRLTQEGVPNRLWTSPRPGGENYIWVRRESLQAAERILSEPALPEDELTALALQDPPPDDFITPEGRPPAPASNGTDPVVRSAAVFPRWLIAAALIGVVALLLAYLPRVSSHEVDRQSSPDGRAVALLLEVPRDAAGAHSYKVCLQWTTALPPQAGDCGREVAYLAGIPADGAARPVTLLWTTDSQLEIRYGEARTVDVYQPMVVWGSRYARFARKPAILVRAVQTGPSAPASHR